jgi:hypothetical protein
VSRESPRLPEGTLARRVRHRAHRRRRTTAARHGSARRDLLGGRGDDDAFYYRIHSPVVLIEYDCHQGVFLDNDQPEPFHVHTIVRTPTAATTDATCCADTSPTTIHSNADQRMRGNGAYEEGCSPRSLLRHCAQPRSATMHEVVSRSRKCPACSWPNSVAARSAVNAGRTLVDSMNCWTSSLSDQGIRPRIRCRCRTTMPRWPRRISRGPYRRKSAPGRI